MKTNEDQCEDSSTSVPAYWADKVKLNPLDDARGADVVTASVPLPEEGHSPVGFEGMPSQTVPIAWYPSASKATPAKPRQVRILGIPTEGNAGTLRLAPVSEQSVICPQAIGASETSIPGWTGPTWRRTVVSEKKLGLMMNETNELTFEHAGRELGVRMGVRFLDGSHRWWEWLQVEQLWTGPLCTAIRAAGYIGITEIDEDELIDPKKYNSGEWYHKHNWLFAEVYAEVFVNGLIRVTARHVNNRIFDSGRDLEGFLPVIAFNVDDLELPDTVLDGTTTDFRLGNETTGVSLDLDRSADLVSAAHPGKIYDWESLAVCQVYEGTEYDRTSLGKAHSEQDTEKLPQPISRWRIEASEHKMWKGMARSFGFDLSFADRPLRTCRYLPAYGWLGHAGSLWPDSLLPARGPFEEICDEQIIGKISLHLSSSEAGGGKPFCSGRYFQSSAGIDGEYAHGIMMQAYRTGRLDLYDAALHHAYAFADLGIDHTDFLHQIGGMPQGSVAPPLQRNLGMLAAYLETGDPYLLRVSESMADAAYAMDRSNWPRRSYGRDSAYIRSLTRLYDVTGKTFYLDRAGEACRRLSECQRVNGSFSDQGGTYGPHAHLNEIVKPWMNSILSEVLVEYLERIGEDTVVQECLVRTADWLLSVLHEDKDGRYWAYQEAWGRNVEDPLSRWSPDQSPRKHPVGDTQLDYNARTLLWLSCRVGDPKYARAWMATYERKKRLCQHGGGHYESMYGSTKIPDNLPWHEAHLWGAHWDGESVSFEPMLELLEIGREARIELPTGKTCLVRRTEQEIVVGDEHDED